MNDQQLEQKVRQDFGKVKKDLTAWAEDNAAQFNKRFGKFSQHTQKTVAVTAKTVKEDVGQGLSQYNTKVMDVAAKIPGNFGKKVASYPFVAITFGLVIGMLLGLLFKPERQTVG